MDETSPRCFGAFLQYEYSILIKSVNANDPYVWCLENFGEQSVVYEQYEDTFTFNKNSKWACWYEENDNNGKTPAINDLDDYFYRYYFKSKDDFTLFKLTWG